MPAPMYIDVPAVRAAGLTDPPYDDAAVTAAILLAQAIIERATRQWFYPKACVFQLDGTDSDALHLPVPIITIDELRINRATDALDTGYYRVYNGPQDRDNPVIKLIESTADNDIFTAPLAPGQMRFRRGRQNQYVSGSFGYVEEDGSVPLLIKRACLILTVEKLANPLYINPAAPPGAPPPPVLGAIIEEGTDGHYVKYAQAGGALKAQRKSAFDGLTSSIEAKTIFKMYRAPIGIHAPADPSYPR